MRNMKRLTALIVGIALTGGFVTAGLTPTRAASDPCASKPSKFAREQCRKFNASAPGDEYFGKQKMSFLGIDNTFRDQSLRSGANTADLAILGKVDQADDALQAWLRKYPNDPQLARSFYLGAETYKKIYIKSAQDKAWSYMVLLIKKFPTTYFGKQAKKEIAIGFTQHWYMDPVPCASNVNAPPPTPVPPSPAPGQPKIQILTPPCTTTTPVPVPTPT
jgi:hypothetical protein